MPEGWVTQAVLEFWAAAPSGMALARDVMRAAPWALPVTVSLVPRLSVSAVERRLSVMGIPYSFACADRRLHGCLVAYAGRGIILVDASDLEDERRYTTAHEVGHFIADYLEPRRRTARRVGPAGIEVLDGVREATPADRFRAALAGQRLEVHTHLTGRRDGEPAAESRADRLAVELLAPEDDALARVAATPDADSALVLHAAYGLPPVVAARYARWLTPPAAAAPGAWLLRRLSTGWGG